MGIQGLLPTFKSIMNPRHIREFAGKRAAIDTYSWLHKAAFSCSKDICEGRPNDKYIDYCLHRVNMLRHYGVQPVLVFDGGGLPMKSEQEIKRARSRKENLERAVEHERMGNHSAAYECYQKAVDITPAVAFRLIKVLRQENVEYVVAPYEADAQMAFLALNGHVDVIITEDSDLIAYGCPQIFFKMDKYGQGVQFQYCDIVSNRDIDFNNFSKQMILEMCIMSGCDYLPSLPGMGVKRAHGLIKRFKNYRKVIKHLKFNGVLIDQQYEQGFERAILTFRHQRVYDPVKGEMVHLTDVPSELGIDLDFLGPYLSQTIATSIARGEVDPTTNKPFEEEISGGRSKAELYAKDKRRSSPSMHLELQAPKNVLTNYFQGSGESAKKNHKAPRNPLTFSPFASPEEIVSQVTPSPTTTSQTYSSPFSKYSLTSEQSPLFETPPLTPFVNEELDLDAEVPRIINIASDYSPPSKRIHKLIGEKQNDENLSPTAMESKLLSRTLEVKSRKPFVSPLSQNVAVQQTAALRPRLEATCLAKTSGYFSRSAPSQLHPISLGTTTKDYQKRDRDVQAKCEASSRSISTDTQNCEEDGIADHMDNFSDVTNFQDPDRGQTKLKTATHRAGQLDAIAAGKRKHIPHVKSNLLGDKATKSRSFSCVSHVGQYASLAQRSMDEFVSAIAPFRCSQTGTRASGLRAPSKHGTPASGLRALSKSGQRASTLRTLSPSGVTRKVSEFAHISQLKVARPASQAVPIAAGTLRWQTYNPSDWDNA